MNKKKISFDFDDTLDRKDIQEYCAELIERGFEPWICTARFDEAHDVWAANWNDDLFKVAKELGIPKEHIIFANMADKWELLKDKGFIWHLDDDRAELTLLNKNTNTRGISCWANNSWKNKCMKLLK